MELKKHKLKLSRLDFNAPKDKKYYNQILFRDVAPTYDLLTTMLSFGRDRHWKYYLMQRLPGLPAPACLDLACGTGDLTIALRERYPNGRITGLDLNDRMLQKAVKRSAGLAIEFCAGDLSQTGFTADSFDVITGGYALRNAPSLEAALQEIHRILKPGGTAAFLDFSKSRHRWIQFLQEGLLTLWGGFWGLLLHGSPEPYAYIAKSLHHFPDRVKFHRQVTAAGFTLLHCKLFFFGFIEIMVLQK